MLRLGIIFGGRSAEHEISILSAASVSDAVDTTKYIPVHIGINKKGEWFIINDDMANLSSLNDKRIRTLIPDQTPDLCSRADAHEKNSSLQCRVQPLNPGSLRSHVDFALPLLHGPYGEDGKIQGLFEMLDLPYGGCGVTASALSMDKLFARDILIRHGLPLCRHLAVYESDYMADKQAVRNRIKNEIGCPVFIKPANMGSSVAVSKVNNVKDLDSALMKAFAFDNRVVAEEAVDAIELETAVLGNTGAIQVQEIDTKCSKQLTHDIAVKAAAVGEIIPNAEFYDYDSKYKSTRTQMIIPAQIPAHIAEQARALAVLAYKALNCEGFARVDFFLDRKSGNILVNEINTIPGFTRYSMFPLLWQAVGLEYPDLIERIIGLGYERYHAKNNREANHRTRQ